MRAFCFILFALCISLNMKSQSLPTEPSESFTFPLGCKATLQLAPIDSTNYLFSVIEVEPFTDMIDMSQMKSIFSKPIPQNTISLIFGIGYLDTNDKGTDKQYNTLLLLKNGYAEELNYQAEMQVSNRDKFENTSVVNIQPKLISIEMWPYKIDNIKLHDFNRIIILKKTE